MAAEDKAPCTPLGGRPPATKLDHKVLAVEVKEVTNPDLATVEALSRLQVSLRGLGWSIGLRNATPELKELLGFCGLGDALPLCDELSLVDEGQTE